MNPVKGSNKDGGMTAGIFRGTVRAALMLLFFLLVLLLGVALLLWLA